MSDFVLDENALNKLRDCSIPDHLLPEYSLLFSRNTPMSNNQRTFISDFRSVPGGTAHTIWLPCIIFDPSKITEDILNQYKDEQLQQQTEDESGEPKQPPVDDPL